MNLFIFLLMAVWLWALIADFLVDIKIKKHNRGYCGNRIKRNTYGSVRRQFVGVGFFIIIAYWIYVWFIQ